MLTLGPGLNPFQAPGDGEIDRLVIAGLEMQEWHEGGAAPVAPEKHPFAEQVERAGDIFAILLRHHQQGLLLQSVTQAAEEVAGEIGRAPFAPTRVPVEIEKAVPVRLGEVVAGEPVERHPGVADALALFSQILALAAGQFAQEFLERCVAAIFPMKLLAGALQIAGVSRQPPFVLGQEGEMQR